MVGDPLALRDESVPGSNYLFQDETGFVRVVVMQPEKRK